MQLIALCKSSMAESSIPILLHSEKYTSFIKYNYLNIKEKSFCNNFT